MPVVTYTKENGEMASCTEIVCAFLLLLLAHSHYGSHKHWASCNGGYVGRKLVITFFNSTKFKKTISFLPSRTSIKIDWSSLTTSAIFPYECSPLKREAMSYLYHNVRIVSESGLCQQFMAFESRNRFIIDCKPLRPSWVVVGQWMLYMTFSQFIQYFRNSCFDNNNNNNSNSNFSWTLGKCTFMNGDIYEGEWSNNKQNGNGNLSLFVVLQEFYKYGKLSFAARDSVSFFIWS